MLSEITHARDEQQAKGYWVLCVIPKVPLAYSLANSWVQQETSVLELRHRHCSDGVNTQNESHGSGTIVHGYIQISKHASAVWPTMHPIYRLHLRHFPYIRPRARAEPGAGANSYVVVHRNVHGWINVIKCVKFESSAGNSKYSTSCAWIANTTCSSSALMYLNVWMRLYCVRLRRSCRWREKKWKWNWEMMERIVQILNRAMSDLLRADVLRGESVHERAPRSLSRWLLYLRVIHRSSDQTGRLYHRRGNLCET